MKLTLSQNELELAVRAYVMGMISLQPGTEVTIDFKAGRGENGISAEVDINHLALAGATANQASTDKIAAAPVKAVVTSEGKVLAADPAPTNVTQIEKPKATKAAAAPATEVEDPPFAGDEPAKEESPAPATPKPQGKTLFSGGGLTPDNDTPAANDAEEEPAQAEAAAGGARRSLFNS